LEKNLNLDQLRSFALVVDAGSFSAAADRLGLTQPAVSLQVKLLERRLGVRLIERVGKRARPTVAGLALLQHVSQIENAVEAAIDAVADHAAGATGRVGWAAARPPASTSCRRCCALCARGFRRSASW
jgi:DNA-binding transcriptional LysR family regulator